MDETKKPDLDEVMYNKTDMRTEDDKKNEAEADDLLDRLKNNACKTKANRKPEPREDPYPNLPKGKLLFQCEEYDSPKEYITLQMNEDKKLIKKIINQHGSLKGHPDIPVSSVEWDLPNLDCIQKAINKEFPDARMIADKGDRLAEVIGKYLGGVPVAFSCYGKLVVRDTATKFEIREVHGAVKALAKVIPAKHAEKIVAREIAKMIQNVL